jgi:hypothetical protein
MTYSTDLGTQTGLGSLSSGVGATVPECAQAFQALVDLWW